MNATAGGAVGWGSNGAPLIKPPLLKAPLKVRERAGQRSGNGAAADADARRR